MSNTVGVRVIDWLIRHNALLPMARDQHEHLSREIDALLDWPDSRKATEVPFFFAIETAGGDWHDGEMCVFGDLESAKRRVEDLNEELPEEEWFRVVPLFRKSKV